MAQMRRPPTGPAYSRSILHVAEKPSMAKIIAGCLEEGASRLEPSFSEYNPIYVFSRQFMGSRNAVHKVTSVTGHMMELAIEEKYSDWMAHDPIDIIEKAAIFKQLGEGKDGIVKNLRKLAPECTDLVLWLDCDREGENICYEVLDICMQSKTNFTVHRAQFSAATKQDILKAFTHLKKPNKLLSEAVNARQEIDLRAGAAFSRLQTLSIRKFFPKDTFGKVISYGPCQLPTLGFIVQRHNTIEQFKKASFWYISLSVVKDKISCDFKWRRERIYDQTVAAILYKMSVIKSEGKATVLKVFREKKTKQKPLPLTTIELQKLASKKLKMNSYDLMRISEKLYCQGLISYPRTETNTFDPSINIQMLIRNLTSFPHLQQYADLLLSRPEKFEPPRSGGASDNAHPPIHPVKFPHKLEPDEFRVYDLIARHFLACCSRGAEAEVNKVMLKLGGEIFYYTGVRVIEKNYLSIYPFETWIESSIPAFAEGETLGPKECLFKEGKTHPPDLLTEEQLITLMERNQIGTDATIHEHIKTVQDRGYTVRTPDGHFKPTALGVALVDAYNLIGVDLAKPKLRAAMEKDMGLIAAGKKQRTEVIEFYKKELANVYREVTSKKMNFVIELEKYFEGSTRSANSNHQFATKSDDWANSKLDQDRVLSPEVIKPMFKLEVHAFEDSVCDMIQRRLLDSPKSPASLTKPQTISTVESPQPIPSTAQKPQTTPIKSTSKSKQTRLSDLPPPPKLQSSPPPKPPESSGEVPTEYPGMPDFGGWSDKPKKASAAAGGAGGYSANSLGKRTLATEPNSKFCGKGGANREAQDETIKHLTKCPGCGDGLIVIRNSRSSRGFFLGCSLFPACRMNGFLPHGVTEATCLKTRCAKCTKFFGSAFHKVKLYFSEERMISTALQALAEEKKHVYCLKCNEDALKQPFAVKSGSTVAEFPLDMHSPDNPTQSTAFGTDGTLPLPCPKCGRPGHLAWKCPYSDFFEEKNKVLSDSKAKGLCFKCGQPGHFASVCTQPIAYKPIENRIWANDLSSQAVMTKSAAASMQCAGCQGSGHTITQCPLFERFSQHLKTMVEEKKGVVCYKCFKLGHFATDCPDVANLKFDE